MGRGDLGDHWQPFRPGHSTGALIVARFVTTAPAVFIQPVEGGDGTSAAG